MTDFRHSVTLTKLLCLAMLLAGSATLPATLVAADIQADTTAVLAVRDRLLDRLGDQLRGGQDSSRLLSLQLTAGILPAGVKPEDNKKRRDLQIELQQAAGQWAPGWGASPTYNKAQHRADSSALRVDREGLRGDLVVQVQADAWVPKDGRTRTQRFSISATIADGKLQGSYQATGDFGDYAGQLHGTVTPAPLPIPEPAAALPAQADDNTAVTVAWQAYQEIRAASACLRQFPQDYNKVLAGVALPTPQWSADAEATTERAAYVAELRRLVEVAEQRIDEQLPVIRDASPCTDAWFGPSGDQPLAEGEDGVAQLPTTVGQAGPQRWRFVPSWSLLAVFPRDGHRHLQTPLLPEILPSKGASYAPPTDLEAYKPPPGHGRAWTRVTSRFMPIAPPGQHYHPAIGQSHGKVTIDAGVHGVGKARWYAAAEVEAPRTAEVWAAILADDLGKLWLNDELVWVSGRQQLPHALIKLPLRAGSNRLLLVCENDSKVSTIGLSFCVQGGPLDPAGREEQLVATRSASAALPPLRIRGRHGDWTSYAADATPPLAWNIRQGTNVAWRVPLPSYSAAPPVVWGDKVFVNCEPHSLYCLDRASGEVLWQRDAHVFQFAPEAERAAAMAAWERGYSAKDHADVKALAAKRAEIADRLRKAGESEKAALSEQEEAVQVQQRQLMRELAGEYTRWCKRLGVREPGWKNNYGWTMGAPVTDGEHVWVKYGTGVAACFDMQGKQRWLRHTGLSGGVGNISSPLLLDGKFIVLGAPVDRKKHKQELDGWPSFMVHKLIAYDALTGELAWEQPCYISGGYGGPSGMVPLRLANGEQRRDLILIGSGLVIDPSDGRLLTHLLGPGPSNWAGDPLVQGNRAYFRRSGKTNVVEYLLLADGEIQARRIATSEKGVYGQPGAVLIGSRMFSNQTKGMGRQPVPWHQIGVVDVTTGKRVAEFWPAIRNGGLAYTPAAGAGEYAALTGTGPGPHAWTIGPGESAEIAFVRNSAQPYVASTCQVQDEAMVAAPVFVDDCMFLRTYRSALCIKVAGKEGRDLVEQHLADAVLQAVPKRPAGRDLHEIVPIADWQAPAGVPVEAFGMRQTAPQAWLGSEPLPPGDDDPLAGIGGRSAASPVPAQAITHGEQEFSFTAVAAEHVRAGKGWGKDMYDRPVYSARCIVDVLGAVGRKTPSRAYFYTVLETEEATVVEVQMKDNPGQRVWFGGREIKDGDVLQLAPGAYALLAESSIGRVPKIIKQIPLALSFVQAEDPGKAERAWREQLRGLRPRMEQVLEALGPGAARLRILKYIQLMDEDD